MKTYNEILTESGLKFHLCIVGGGLHFLNDTLLKGGASSWLAELVVPNGELPFTSRIIRGRNLGPLIVDMPKAVSKQSAEYLARSLSPDICTSVDADVFYACTAKLCKTEGERKHREHEAYICFKEPRKKWFTYHLNIPNPNPDMPLEQIRQFQEIWLSNQIMGDLLSIAKKNKNLKNV